MTPEDHQNHQKRILELTTHGVGEPDQWEIGDGRIVIEVSDSDIMNYLEAMVLVRLRDLFDRINSEEKPVFKNFLELTLSVEAQRIWLIVEIDEEFLNIMQQKQSITFGTSKRNHTIKVRDTDIESIRDNWEFFHDDDRYFKERNEN